MTQCGGALNLVKCLNTLNVRRAWNQSQGLDVEIYIAISKVESPTLNSSKLLAAAENKPVTSATFLLESDCTTTHNKNQLR
jgi:hypothetical protein